MASLGPHNVTCGSFFAFWPRVGRIFSVRCDGSPPAPEVRTYATTSLHVSRTYRLANRRCNAADPRDQEPPPALGRGRPGWDGPSSAARRPQLDTLAVP